jgi:hypothetical protein
MILLARQLLGMIEKLFVHLVMFHQLMAILAKLGM